MVSERIVKVSGDLQETLEHVPVRLGLDPVVFEEADGSLRSSYRALGVCDGTFKGSSGH